jgi:ribonucleoside-triphosphate reductase
LKVIKRDGIEQDFNTNKIFNAVKKACSSVGYSDYDSHNIADQITTKVVFKLTHEHNLTVERIQDVVENTLMVSKHKDIAKHYIRYRAERDRIREGKHKVFYDIEEFLNGSNEDVSRENSNKDSNQTVTHRDLIAGIVSKHLAKTSYPQHLIELEDKGAIHIHDKDYFISKGIHNCGVYDFEYMLANGVKLGDVEIEQPNSIGTAANVACQIFSKISGSSYGGQSMHEFDKVLQPYAEKSLKKIKQTQEKYGLPDSYVEESLRKEIYDACQKFIYQIQTVTSSNGQSAFTTISLSLSQDPLCKMIKEEYLKCHINGIGKEHRSPIFPKVLYFVEEGVNLNKEDPNHEEFILALECSAKHMYPDFVMAPNNRKMTGNSENVITAMGCRSFVGKYTEDGKEKVSGRFNLGVTTVSLPYAALKADGDKDKFFDELSFLCDKAFEANMFRIERMKGTKAKVSPILWQYGALATLKAEDTIDHLFYNGNATCSIGYGGLYEAQEILNDMTKHFGMKVIEFLKDKTEEYTKKTNIAFSPYGSPLENGCYTIANKLKSEFPEWKFDRDFITNSFHQPVFKNLNIVDKFDEESDYYLLASGGNVNNIELPSMINNIEGFESVVKAAYDKVNYLICNQPVDKCFECGYRGEFDADEHGYFCPECGNNNPETAECIKRISGYTHSALARPANKGKFDEQKCRVKNA